MLDLPLVSILTPTYNQAMYLGECMDSVHEQTYTGWEQSVVDDGSTDSTQDLLSRRSDSRLMYFRVRHRGLEGLAETYNLALRRASGELIAILEGDDCWPRDKLEYQVKSFERKNVILTWGQGLVIDSAGSVIGGHAGVVGAETTSFGRREVSRRLLWA